MKNVIHLFLKIIRLYNVHYDILHLWYMIYDSIIYDTLFSNLGFSALNEHTLDRSIKKEFKVEIRTIYQVTFLKTCPVNQ